MWANHDRTLSDDTVGIKSYKTSPLNLSVRRRTFTSVCEEDLYMKYTC